MPQYGQNGAKLTQYDDLQALLGGDSGDPHLAKPVSRPESPDSRPVEARVALLGHQTTPETESGIPGVVHETELAELLGVSASAVRNLAKERVAVRVKPSHYATRPSLANYLERQRVQIRKAGNPKGNAQLDAEKLRGAKATADKLELANAKARGDMVEASAVERAWSNILRDVRSALLAVPSRIGATLPHLSAHDVAELDREIKAALEGLANGD